MKKYGYAPDREKMDGDIARIAQHLESVKSEAVLKDCFSFLAAACIGMRISQFR